MVVFDTLNPFYLSVGNIYLQYYHFIDSIIALILFVSIANWVFTRRYGKDHNGHKEPSRESKLIAIAVGLALTVAFAVFELNSNFMFGDMAPVSFLIILLILGLFLYEMFIGAFGEEKKGCAFAFVYLIIYGLFMGVKSGALRDLFMQYTFVWGILNIGFIVAFVKFLMCLVGMFSNGGAAAAHESPHEAHKEEKEAAEKAAAEAAEKESIKPIAVNIIRPKPGEHLPATADVTVEGEVVGGSEPLYWNIRSDARHSIDGMGKHIHGELGHLTPGEHTVVAYAQDAHTMARKDVKFTIEGAVTALTGAVEILAITNDGRPVTDAIVTLHDLSGSPLRGPAAPYQHAVDGTGKYRFDKVPIGPLLVQVRSASLGDQPLYRVSGGTT